jgi:hypothetical protein
MNFGQQQHVHRSHEQVAVAGNAQNHGRVVAVCSLAHKQYRDVIRGLGLTCDVAHEYRLHRDRENTRHFLRGLSMKNEEAKQYICPFFEKEKCVAEKCALWLASTPATGICAFLKSAVLQHEIYAILKDAQEEKKQNRPYWD